MSSVGDPRNILSFYFPLCFQVSHVVGIKMLWVAVIGDWFNLIFKWILFGHRPYWWVHETQFYQNNSHPHLEQFHITCETGPGSPSGHAMGSSSVWYVIVTSVLHLTQPSKSGPRHWNHRLWITWSLLWIAFWIIQIIVCISRVFVATHFPHQVILGVLAGVLVAEAFEHLPSIHTANLNVYIQTNLFLLSFASGFYLLHRMANIDLMWSVPKAKKWCVDPAWIHLDSSPFAGLVRNSGALLGLGLALHSQMFLQSCRGRNGQRASFRLVCTGASLGALRLCELMEVSMKTELLFHAFSFCKSAVGPLSVVALVPYCLHVLTGVRENKLH
uniref:glucose-6-phosphatase n=2 Tax=Scleropages formosus TaxID=113540 RepID=A0A8C9T4X6_SCLFO